MTFKTFLAEAIILEGGVAIKNSVPISQSEVRELIPYLYRDLQQAFNIPYAKITAIGSAGLKPNEQLSGDIDIAIEFDNLELVKANITKLASQSTVYPFEKFVRFMPGLNVYSYGKLHKGKLIQIDIIPTTNIKLCKWSYFNSQDDLSIGLKGSHRNELLFGIAKFAEMQNKNISGTCLERLRFDLSRGLYMYTQDRQGKRGVNKNFKTTERKFITSDPDQICQRLFGPHVLSKDVMSFKDAYTLVMSNRFKHKDKLKDILTRTIEGLISKKLVIPPVLQSVQASAKLEFNSKDIIKNLTSFILENFKKYHPTSSSIVDLYGFTSNIKILNKTVKIYSPSTNKIKIETESSVSYVMTYDLDSGIEIWKNGEFIKASNNWFDASQTIIGDLLK